MNWKAFKNAIGITLLIIGFAVLLRLGMNVDGVILAVLVVAGIYSIGFICGYIVCEIFKKP